MDDNRMGPLMPAVYWGEAPVRDLDKSDGDFVLPVGTVTLLLADIEGSTTRWEDDPEVMTSAIARFDEVVGELVGRHGGVRPVEQGEGDSFVAAFARASDAVAAAVAIQQAGLSPIRLRMGLHTGEVQLRDEGNYIGTTINRAARLRDVAHGGQVVLSGATQDLVVDRLPDGCWLQELGTHRLRDLTRPERVFQLCHPRLPEDFPPLRSLDSYPHNLPVQLTTFIGRGEAMAEVTDLVEQHRSVTLTGTGGCGKTRLALQVAADLLGSFPHGVWFAELAPITDPSLVGRVVVRALGLQDEPFRSAVETVTHHMRDKTALLVLDNCEHVVGDAAALAEAVLRSCPSMTIIATSREPLGTTGEVIWRVPSLSLPESDGEPAQIAGVNASEAVELFVERARRARPAFTLDDSNTAAVVGICRRLDGLPLAIELAAVRVRVLTPERIAATIGDAFRVLAGGARTAVPRQQTLRASIEWSHALLSDTERILFRRLGVFAGSFDLDAAEGVAPGDGLAAHHVLDHLSLLVDKSLVLTDGEVAGDVRYRLLETVRQFALEHLERAGELEATRVRHRDHYLATAEAGRTQDAARMDRMEADFDNLRAALQFSRERGARAEALRLPLALNWAFTERGLHLETRQWLEESVADSDGVDPVVRGRALATVATNRRIAGALGGRAFAEEAVELLHDTGDEFGLCMALSALGVARSLERLPYREALEDALALARRSGDPRCLVPTLSALTTCSMGDEPRDSLHWAEEMHAVAQELGATQFVNFARSYQGLVAMFLGPLERALDLLEQLVSEATASRDTFHIIGGNAFKAICLAQQGDVAAARRSAQLAIDMAGARGLAVGAGWGSLALGHVALVSGELDGALDAMVEGWPHFAVLPGPAEIHLAVRIELALAAGGMATARGLIEQTETFGTNHRYGRAMLQTAHARFALVEGDTRVAEDLLHDALATWRDQGAWVHAPHALDLLGQVAAIQESYEEATRLIAASTALHTRIGSVRFATEAPAYEQTLASARAALGEEAFTAVWEEGTALDADAAAAYAARGRGERKRPSSGWDSLTPTELDVVALVSEGLPNKEIAARLFVSPRTVQTHLTHVYAKLGITSRVQLAQAASRAGERGPG